MKTEEGRQEFASTLLSIILTAIPDAENETIGFLQSMTRPSGVIERAAGKLSKKDSEHNDALFARYGDEMFNPELDDTISLLELIIANEASEIQALGKKLRHLMTVAGKAMVSETPQEAPEGADLHSPDLTPTSSTS
jgi:hypothetical protein